MELDLAQDISSIYQDPLSRVFMDLWKAYNTVERDRLLTTLEGYVAEPCIFGLLENFWECHQVVPRQNGFHGLAIPVTRGTMQAGLVYPTMFNVVLDNVI